MLERLLAVCTYGRDDAPELVYGTLPVGMTGDELAAMRGDKTTVRRLADNLVLMAPAGAERWACWFFDKVPAVTELPALIQTVQTLSAGLLAPKADNTNAAPRRGGAVALLLPLLAGARRPSKAGLLQLAANALVEAGQARQAVIVRCGRRRLARLAASDQRLLPRADELRHVLSAVRADTPVSRSFDRDEVDAEGLEPALLAEMVGEERVLLDVPARGEEGWGFAVFGAEDGVGAELEQLRGLISVSLGSVPRSKGRSRRLMRRAAAVAAVAALGWFLFTPAPLRITATATSDAAEGMVAALPFEAFLDRVLVEVGDVVHEGQPLAVFRAPNQEEQRAEAKLAVAIEEIAARSAMAQNDYGAYVLAEQRVETNRRRLEQLEARLARLSVKAPADGRVISTIGGNLNGRYVPTGQEVAVVQASDTYEIALTISRVDAPLVAPGQRGEVYFRGLPGRSYGFEVMTPVVVQVDPETGRETLTARARVLGEDLGELSVGLAGYSRLQVGEDLRIKSMSRYAVEFVRVKAWTYLGLRL